MKDEHREVPDEDRRAARAFAELVAVMRALRGPDGCPWDLEQDFGSLRRFVLEEAYEVVQAIDEGDLAALQDELGDLALQIVFLSRLAEEEGAFDIADVMRGIHEKMVRRHPHVFGDVDVEGSGEVLRNWEAIKRQERDASSVLDDVPGSLPALARAEKLGSRAAQLSFDWPDAAAVLEKVEEELAELRRALARAPSGPEVEAELGDLLLALTSFARHVGVAPEMALRAASAKFERRFRLVEDAVTKGRIASTVEEMEAEWRRVKAAD